MIRSRRRSFQFCNSSPNENFLCLLFSFQLLLYRYVMYRYYLFPESFYKYIPICSCCLNPHSSSNLDFFFAVIIFYYILLLFFLDFLFFQGENKRLTVLFFLTQINDQKQLVHFLNPDQHSDDRLSVVYMMKPIKNSFCSLFITEPIVLTFATVKVKRLYTYQCKTEIQKP